MRLQRPRMAWQSLLTVLALVLLCGLARAESKSYAVLIGIGEYEDAAIKPRAKAESDVKALYDFLTSPANKSLYKADQVKLLLGAKDDKRPSEPATKANILQALKWAFSSAGEDDTVILCWIGQGAPAGKATCYFAHNSTLANREKDAVTSADIEELFKTIKSNSVLVLLDVDFKGYSSKDEIPGHSLDNAFKEYAGAKEDAEDTSITKPLVLLSATRGFAASPETEQGGLFMKLVLEALSGKADQFGGEADGIVTVDELVEHLTKNYIAETQKALNQKRLEPAYYPYFRVQSTHFALAINPPAAEAVARRLAAFEKLAKELNLKEELTQEGRTLLAKMPLLENQQQLRKKYEELADGKLPLADFKAERDKLIAAGALPRADAEAFADKVMKISNLAVDDYVKQVKPRDLIAAAVRGLYRAADEKLSKEMEDRIKNLSEPGDPGQLRELLIDARLSLGNRKELKGSKDADAALALMLHSLDNHSTYIDPETKRSFDIQMQQRFIGVGIQIVKDVDSDYIRVTSPIRGSPAYKAGVKKDDLLIKVVNYTDKEGKELPEPKETSTKGMSSTDVVKLILGKRGTTVKLVFLREFEDGKREVAFDLKRDTVSVETVFGVKRKDDDSWDYWLDKENKIAYIHLSQFALNTTADLRRALRELTSQSMRGLVLDLRFNPGGYLAAVRKRESGREEVYRATARGAYTNFPLVVLVNGGSASASEIVSACLQDQQRALVMGERTYGKGSVQNVRDVDVGDGPAEVKLTIASFWRPSGKNLNRFPSAAETDDWGVTPNENYLIKLDPLERSKLFDHMRENEAIPRRDAPAKTEAKGKPFEDRQLKAALEYLRKETAVSAKKSN
jgi:carboxyl-terminal processing protease